MSIRANSGQRSAVSRRSALGAVCCLMMASMLGCATPGAQAVLKAGAKLALSFAVRELGERVKEVRPYEDRLKSLIETTFSQPLPAEALGTRLKAGVVAVVPVDLQATVLAQFRESLAGGKAPAASPGHADFNQRVARQL